jgi:hypothetical protein
LAFTHLSTKIISLILVCLQKIYIYINKYCIPTWFKQNRTFDACATIAFSSELYENYIYNLMFSKWGNYRQGFSSQSLHQLFAYRLTTDAYWQTCQKLHICQCNVMFRLGAETKHENTSSYTFKSKNADCRWMTM